MQPDLARAIPGRTGTTTVERVGSKLPKTAQCRRGGGRAGIGFLPGFSLPYAVPTCASTALSVALGRITASHFCLSGR